MCLGCSEPAKKVWIFGSGAFILLIALILGLLWPRVAINMLFKELVLRDGSLNYNNWLKTPIPMYFEVTMFHWDNPEDIHNPSIKPRFIEKGPYVFLEVHTRNELDWHPENYTISFNQTRTWYFQSELSNGTLDDAVTNLNVIASSVAYKGRHMNSIMKTVLNYIINSRNATLFVTKSVREWIFDGYDDKLLDFLKESESPAIDLPFDRFGWFYSRNGSSSYDGRINMFTGQDRISQLGKFYSWNNNTRTPYYPNGCGEINGTTGEIWPPGMHPTEPITLFITDVCRSLTLNYGDTIERHEISGSKWIGDDQMFDNGIKYPKMSCFCTGAASDCPDLQPGVLNVSDCRYGAPAFISYPHFYLADQSYLNNLVGLEPNRTKHEFSIALEPTTGIPLEVNARLQINILLEPVAGLSLFENVPKVMTPMFWFTQTVTLNEEFAKQAKLAISLPMIGVYAAYGFVTLAIILLLLGTILSCTKSWNRHQRFYNDDDNELNRD